MRSAARVAGFRFGIFTPVPIYPNLAPELLGYRALKQGMSNRFVWITTLFTKGNQLNMSAFREGIHEQLSTRRPSLWEEPQASTMCFTIYIR